MDYTWLYLIGSFVIGVLLRHMLDGEKWQFGDLRTVVAMLVAEAEQTMPGVVGEDKLAWVLGQCDRIGLTRFISEEVLSAMIESAVFWLKNQRPIAPVLPAPDPSLLLKPMVVPPPPGARDITDLAG